jgi:ClpP class serine protease
MKQQRAYLAAVNGDWAIQFEWIDRILEIAAREHGGLQAVEAERGEELEYAYNVEVRDGVAIIPITGPIFRYANLFTYYSGGTSVSIIARDFNIALNDARVDSILFEINSPGGEVTGISELANMIYAARGRKPMTARVGGMCCSAAIWLASACGDIVIDDTAILGSIGVYAAYLDTKKADAKNGFREIKIVSNQSPKKVPDPSTPEGEKLIQARVNALADVFIAAVARNRDVSVETVMSDFGQGDVFIGQHAVDAGLADRLASFEEALAELAQAHGPASGAGYTGALYGDASGINELLMSANVVGGAAQSAAPPADNASGSQEEPEEEDVDPAVVPEDDTENGDPDDEDQNDDSAHAPQNPPAAALDNKNEGAEPMATETTAAEANSDQAAINSAELERMKAELAAANAGLAKANGDIATMQKEARTSRLKGMAASFIGEQAGHLSMLEHLAESAGEESAIFKSYVTQQTAVAEQTKTSNLFKTAGREGEASNDSALGKLTGLATEIAKSKGLSFAKAFDQACSENKELYNQYDAERRG